MPLSVAEAAFISAAKAAGILKHKGLKDHADWRRTKLHLTDRRWQPIFDWQAPFIAPVPARGAK